MSLIVLYFLHSTSVLSFYIDVVLALSVGSDNGLLPVWHQAIIWTNAGLLIGPLGTNPSEIQIRFHTFWFKVLLQWNSTSVYNSCTYSTYHLELALGTFMRHFVSACLVYYTSWEKIYLNSYSKIHGSRKPMRSNLSFMTAALPRL